ncbi:MAG: dephospho-CoA kinase, partial [Varibaculum timonense]
LYQRSGLERQQVDARIAAQASDEERRAIANFELVNDTSCEDLRRTVASELWPELRRLANGDS